MARPLILGCLLLLSANAGHSGACQVPVFRYALERWPADAHRLFVTGPAATPNDVRHHANLRIERVKSDLRGRARISSQFPAESSSFPPKEGFLVRRADAGESSDSPRGRNAARGDEGQPEREVILARALS